ncbi:MAG: DUF3034 domain-containing protein [Betaproteobacteria bacterium HGW-Betaproteobacteria-9]|jgi:hypothetical protein|nr:MAG: DUF3034 domain-containing protein [Betaproteobacteria bacterium HGW-Betaproteobacteria-9]
MNHLTETRRRQAPSTTLLALAATAALLAAVPAQADTGKLLLTGGVSTVEGAAGGGISPWAVIGSQATEGEKGISAYLSRVETRDHDLTAAGVAVGLNDRVELSFGHQDFDTGIAGALLGLPGLHLKQDILGAKLRLAGDAVLGSDTLMPQIAVGVQVKRLRSSGLDGTLDALGAKRDGVDVYVSATKLFLAQGVVVNGTLRATQANQNGLLGFGARLGGADNGYQLMPELSVAYLLSKNVAVGFEYRAMPNKLQRAGAAAGLGDGLRSDDWKDIFIAWAPSKNVSLTAAYVDLGRIVPATTGNQKQTGVYLSAQIAF